MVVTVWTEHLYGKDRPPSVAVDFDGTIAEFSDGWQGPTHFGEVNESTRWVMQQLADNGWVIIIWTTRVDSQSLRNYLRTNGVPFDYINENPSYPLEDEILVGLRKIPADVYWDDRAVRFDGYKEKECMLKTILNFKPWELRDDPNPHPRHTKKNETPPDNTSDI